MKYFDAMVLGAGAAGLMCAIEAGRRGRRVVVLESGARPGRKILISGGGRCNFTNTGCKAENFLSNNPHFARSALARYTPQDILTLVESHGVAWHEKTLGQLFCDHSARQIVEMLLAECASAGVEIVTGVETTRIIREGAFTVETAKESYRAPALVVATGGLSIPKMGATGFGYELARQFGVKIVPTRPALVPLMLVPEDAEGICDLSGVSAEAIVQIEKSRSSFREKILVTHRGLSGPVILQISSYWHEGEAIEIDWVPGKKVLAALRASSAGRDAARLATLLREHLPQRLADRLVELLEPQSWTNASIDAMEERLHRWPVVPAGTEGYEKAEVTAGGVDTDELSAKTMECKRIPGLFFIGEVVDVTGWLGGYNFQWAWASGAAAGRAL